MSKTLISRLAAVVLTVLAASPVVSAAAQQLPTAGTGVHTVAAAGPSKVAPADSLGWQ
ncbi:hypothetical protein [Kitasatospora mediocidica]|uniref:hypothetical protein n=1 Tax=Kitasatospora mediocidica TaxID=58352 RepID=UPI000A796763|nr:hypothetical protein [Kitasatospora mediocidica]